MIASLYSVVHQRALGLDLRKRAEWRPVQELDMMIFAQIQVTQVLTHELQSAPRLPKANGQKKAEVGHLLTAIHASR